MTTQLLTIPQACTMLNCGKTYLYSLINQGRLKAVKLSKKTLISKQAIDEFIAELDAYPTTQNLDDNGE